MTTREVKLYEKRCANKHVTAAVIAWHTRNSSLNNEQRHFVDGASQLGKSRLASAESLEEFADCRIAGVLDLWSVGTQYSNS